MHELLLLLLFGKFFMSRRNSASAGKAYADY